MLFRIDRSQGQVAFHRYPKTTAAQTGVLEKDIENWMVRHPDLLFGTERVLVIGQSVSGQSMADILALDGDGNLVIVELKRNWSDRSTVGQLLEYAARLSEMSFDDIQDIARRFLQEPETSLINRFNEFFDTNFQSAVGLAKGHRLVIVAPDTDDGLRRIVRWLKGYGIKVDFVPFSIYSTEGSSDLIFELDGLKVPTSVNASNPATANLFFNTNETWSPGAYRKMFQQKAIAIFGYETGPQNLMGARKGQRVFAYVNRRGVMAAGVIVDGEVRPGTTIFGENEEYHLAVNWTAIVSEQNAVSRQQVQEKAHYNLPVRTTFCSMNNPEAADWICAQLVERQEGPS